jgi:hypothetical protein
MAPVGYVLFVVLVSAVMCSYGPLFWPIPQTVKMGTDNFTIDPCKVNYKVTTTPVYLIDNINLYLIEAFKCKKQTSDSLS